MRSFTFSASNLDPLRGVLTYAEDDLNFRYELDPPTVAPDAEMGLEYLALSCYRASGLLVCVNGLCAEQAWKTGPVRRPPAERRRLRVDQVEELAFPGVVPIVPETTIGYTFDEQTSLLQVTVRAAGAPETFFEIADDIIVGLDATRGLSALVLRVRKSTVAESRQAAAGTRS